jgi:NAD(P)-dependent dehydrogenase (short-subunit alcohol dehydrogenase family)
VRWSSVIGPLPGSRARRTRSGAFSREGAGDRHYVRRAYPAGRIGRPGDVAAAALYLAAPANAWGTGSILTVDGGFGVR